MGEFGYSGRMGERDMLGDPLRVRRSSPEKEKEFARVQRFKDDLAALRRKFGSNPETGYLPFEVALQFAREHQFDDVESPSQPFGHELLTQMAGLLMEKYGYEDVFGEDLRFYSAVNTPLDVYHGIDAWVEIRHPKTGNYRRVTLDITQNAQKLREGHKADVLVPVIQDYPLEPKTHVVSAAEKQRFMREKAIFRKQVYDIAEQVLQKAFGR